MARGFMYLTAVVGVSRSGSVHLNKYAPMDKCNTGFFAEA